jgi:hypothetical protein
VILEIVLGFWHKIATSTGMTLISLFRFALFTSRSSVDPVSER